MYLVPQVASSTAFQFAKQAHQSFIKASSYSTGVSNTVNIANHIMSYKRNKANVSCSLIYCTLHSPRVVRVQSFPVLLTFSTFQFCFERF